MTEKETKEVAEAIAKLDAEIEKLTTVLTKIAKRKPSTYEAASAFYLSRREAQEVLDL